MTRGETKVAMWVLMIGGPIVGGFVMRGDPANPVQLVVGMAIALGSWCYAIHLASKAPPRGHGGADR